MDLRTIPGLLLVILLKVITVKAKGTIGIQIVKFANPSSSLVNGYCCDGYPHTCTSQCDHKFHFCLKDVGSPPSNQQCSLGEGVVYGPADTDMIENIDTNKVSFSFDVWQGSFQLRLNVTDIDTSSEEDVDIFLYNFTNIFSSYNYSVGQSTPDHVQLYGTRSMNATKLDLDIWVYCATNFYGPDCSAFCIPEDSCNGHYKCGNVGEKLCLPGWGGGRCNYPIPGGVAECPTGALIPRGWIGKYMCGSIVENFTLTVDIKVFTSTGVLHLSDGSYTVAGSMTRDVVLLGPQNPGIWLIKSPRNTPQVTLRGKFDNSTSISGHLSVGVSPGESSCGNFSLHWDSVSQLFRCLNGATCIRDDARNIHICCCAPGWTGTSCEEDIDECVIQPCLNGGTCNQTAPPGYSCSCPDGFFGPRCELTECPPNYYGSTCGVLCVPDNSCHGHYTCNQMTGAKECLSKWIGNDCTKRDTTSGDQDPECFNNVAGYCQMGECFNRSCCCSPGTTGPRCENIDDCQSKPCANNATCQDFLNHFQCICQDGYTGSTCDVEITTPLTTFTSEMSSTLFMATSIHTNAASGQTTLTTVPQTTMTTEQLTPTVMHTSNITLHENMATHSTEELTPTVMNTPNITLRENTVAQSTEGLTSTVMNTPNITLHENTATHSIEELTPTVMNTPNITLRENTVAHSTEGLTSTVMNTPNITLHENTDVRSTESTSTEPITNLNITEHETTFTSATEITLPYITTLSQRNTFTTILRSTKSGTEENSTTIELESSSTTGLGSTQTITASSTLQETLSVTQQVAETTVAQHTTSEAPNAIQDTATTTERAATLQETISVPATTVELMTTSEPMTTGLQTTTIGETTVEAITTTPQTTTPEPVVAHESNTTYSIVLVGVLEEIVIGQVEIAIKQAWIKMNEGMNLNESSLDVYNVTTAEAIGIDREFVVEISYMLRVDVQIQFPLIVPSTRVIRGSILTVHRSGIYSGTITLYLANHFQLLIEGTPPSTLQYRQIELVLQYAWTRNLSIACHGCILNVTVPITEEFVGEHGVRITKVYYFVKVDNVIQIPGADQWKTAPLDTIQETFRSRNISVIVYRGDSVFRFRFHYFVDFVGHIYEESSSEIQAQLSQVWKNKSTDLGTCGCLNVTIIRLEKYITMNGLVVTRLIYFVKVRSMIQSYFNFTGPSSQDLSVGLIVTNPSTKFAYQIHTSSSVHLYRYDLQYNLYVKDDIDIATITVFKERLKIAWKYKWAELEELQIVVPTVHHCIAKTEHSQTKWVVGQHISRLVYFILWKGEIINPFWTRTLAKTDLDEYVSNVTSTSDHIYELYHETEAVYLQTQHYSVHLNGHFVLEHQDNIKDMIRTIWSQHYAGSLNISVTMIEELCTEERNVVTGIYYTLTVDSRFIDAAVSYKAQFNTSHLEHLLQLATTFQYSLYLGSTTTLISYRYGVFLHFKQSIAELDYSKFESQIQSAWAHLHPSVKDIHIRIAGVMQYYTETKTMIWRLTYFIRRGKITISPLFVPKVEERHFLQCACLNVVGFSRRTYQLYVGSRTLIRLWWPSSYQFSVVFTKEVSRLDWAHIRHNLELRWRSRYTDVNVNIVNQEECLTVSGTSVWKLVYFVSRSVSISISKNDLVPSLYVRQLDIHHLDLSFNNVYGGRYVLSTVSLATTRRYRYAFSVVSSYIVNEPSMGNFISALRTVLCRQVHVEGTCDKMTIAVARQEEIISHSSSFWRVLFHVRYNSRIIDSTAWPMVNTSSLQEYIDMNYNLTSSSGSHYTFFINTQTNTFNYKYHFGLFLATKVAPVDYSKFQIAIKQTWLSQHPEYETCGCVNVVIKKQEELVDSRSQSLWNLVYFMVVNGTIISPAYTTPINYTILEANMTGPRGSYVLIKDYAYNLHYYNARYSHALYVQTWPSKSDYSKFELRLKEYLKSIWSYNSATTDIVVHIGKPQLLTTVDGQSVWKLVYFVRVNGRLIYTNYLPPLNHQRLESYLNFTTPLGVHYSLFKGSITHLWSYNNLFHLYLDHPIAPSVWIDLKSAIIRALYLTTPEYKTCDCMEIDLPKLQTEFLTVNRTSVWKLGYRLKLHGVAVDSLVEKTLDVTKLREELAKLQGPNGIRYNVLGRSETDVLQVTSRNVFSLHLNHYVSSENRAEIITSIKTAWAKIKSDIDKTQLHVHFIRQTEYIDQQGVVRWKFDYSIQYNNSLIFYGDWQKINISVLTDELQTLKTQSGKQYDIFDVSYTSTVRYDQLFSIHSSTKVAVSDFVKLKLELKRLWKISHPVWGSCGCLEVQNIRQEELIDRHGRSVWKIMYSLSINGSIMEATMYDNFNSTYLKDNLIVSGPRGIYDFHVLSISDQASFTRYGYSFMFFLNNKMDESSLVTLKKNLEEIIQEQQIDLHGQIDVSIQRQEETFTSSKERIWKVVYFVKKADQYQPPTAVMELNFTKLNIKLGAMLGPRGQTFKRVTGAKLLEYRNHFSVILTSNVAVSQYHEFETAIIQSWQQTNVEYKNCSCLSVNIVDLEEVIDIHGRSYWNLVYFLSVNKTTVESLTSVDVNSTYLKQLVSKIIRPTGERYQVALVETSALTRSTYTHAIYFRSEMDIFDKVTLEHRLKLYWQGIYSRWASCGCMNIHIRRQQQYLVKIEGTWEKVWSLEYHITTNGVFVERLETFPVNATLVQEKFNFTSSRSNVYNVTEIKTSTSIEYRWHFSLFVSRQVKQTDFLRFTEVIKSSMNETISGELDVLIPSQEEVVGIKGKSLWKLVVFIQNDSKTLDSSLSAPLNITFIRTKIIEHGIVAVRGSYTIVQVASSVSLRRYSEFHSCFLNVHIQERDIIVLQMALSNTWHLIYQAHHSESHLSVEIVRQEDFISLTGAVVAKVVYSLKIDGQSQSSTQLPQLNATVVQQQLGTATTSRNYSVVQSVSTLVRYEQHFSLVLTRPVLYVDRVTFQKQLKLAWSISKNVSVESVDITMMKQEEIRSLTLQSSSLWRLLFLVRVDGRLINAQVERDIVQSDLIQNLQITQTATSDTYRDLLRLVDTSGFPVYRNLFRVYFYQKVANSSYESITDGIEQAWLVSKNRSVSASIVGQEKVYQPNGLAVWKLKYTVLDTDVYLRSDIVLSPSMEALNATIFATSDVFGYHYIPIELVEERRLSYSLSLVLDRRIYRVDQQRFTDRLLTIWRATHLAFVSIDVKIEFVSYERLIDSKNTSVWRHVCFVHENGQVVNSAEYRRLDITDVQKSLNFSTPKGQSYKIISTTIDSTYRQYDLQFNVLIQGRIKPSYLTDLTTPIVLAWAFMGHHTSDNNYVIPSTPTTEERVGINGEVVTKVNYFVTFQGEILDPKTTRAPSSAAIVDRVTKPLRIESYNLQTAKEYTSLFSLYIRAQSFSMDDKIVLEGILQKAWKKHRPDIAFMNVSISKIEAYAGNYGVRVTKLMYTISATTQHNLEAGLDVEPSATVIETEFQASQHSWQLYQRKEMYRLDVIYSLSLNTVLGKVDKLEIENSLETAFMMANTGSENCTSCNVSVTVVSSCRLVSESGIQLTSIAYTVSRQDMRLESWKDDGPGMTTLQEFLNQSDSRYQIWAQPAFTPRTLYINTQYSGNADLATYAIRAAWQANFRNGDIVVNVTEEEGHVDENWNILVKLEYRVTVNGTEPPKTGIVQEGPTDREVEYEFLRRDKRLCDCMGRKRRKVYVKGKKDGTINFGQVIHSAWMKHNPEVNASLLEIRVKVEITRRKRAVSDTPKLVDENGKDVSIIEYTASIDGDEPQDLFIESPTPETVDNSLKAVGSGLCNCTPSAAHTIRVAGPVTTDDKKAIKAAIKDAIAAENPGLAKDDIMVDITNVSTKTDGEGNTVSDVDYTVSHAGGKAVEDLTNPSETKLESALNDHGIRLPDHTIKESKKENEDWKIIVGVVVGVGGFTILCVIIACYVIHKRKVGKENLKRRGEDITTNNVFDEEQFSDPAVFTNPAFDKNRHPLDPFSTKSL